MKARALVSAGLGALVGFAVVQPVGAAPTDVVISELMYHPADAAPVEFLELTNRGGSTEDLSGWCLATGIDFCFPAGTSIDPGERLVVTDDLAGFAGVYGNAVTPAGQYDGGLSNGGETIDLLDGAAAVIDTVTYDDSNPWPATPDGDGPSLELIDLDTDNNDAANWAASIDPSGHTVGAVNSLDGLVLPTIENVTADPFRPLPNDDVTISAQLADANAATLSYVINWDTEQTVTMDDGPASVGGAGDGVWSATIPGQSAGDLIRYRVDISGGGGATGAPVPGDSIDYLGVVVVDSNVSTNLPLLEWFMEDSVHDDLLANHRFDDVTGDAVVSYDGVVYDNVEMYIRGNSSRSANKVSWKVEFPSGYLFDMGGLLDRPVDEFNMQRSNYVNEELGWGTAEAAGMVALQYFKIRTHRNGEFYSVATYGGTYDGRWRDDNDRSDWALYKAEKERGRALPSEAALIASGDWDKKEGDDDDWSDLQEFLTVMNGPSNAAQRDWMLENLNVPEFVNYAAVISVLRHSDTNWYNYYVTRDSEGTGRWEMMLWDMDLMFRVDADDDDGEFVTPADNGNLLMTALMDQPDFRQMYFRRVRSLIDEFLPPTAYEDWANSIFDTYRADFELDRDEWGGRTAGRHEQVLFDGIAARRADIAANTGPEGTRNFPPSASGQLPIEILSIDYAPAAGDDAEYIELTNTSATESIDVSGWAITGPVSGTITSGAVILPGASAYVVADDNAFRAANGADLVIGTFDSSLPDAGATVTLTTGDGDIVDTVTYPVGVGETDVTYVGLTQSWRYFDQGPAANGWQQLGFDDAAWAAGNGEFGFGDGDENTVVDSAQRTSYFRKTFTVADADDVVSLEASLRADDGAVVYINGVEVVRDNMPAGAISHDTSAASTRYSDENDLRSFSIPVGVVRSGANVIAVEIHNRSLSSSDLSFDLSLEGRVTGDGGGGGTPPGRVIDLADTWRYFDQGPAAAGWQGLSFADATWANGNGEFGFGDGDENTIVTSAQRTSYFRKSFTIDELAPITDVTIMLRADDGAVVYLNGVEVVRDNMPAGTIGHNTNAASTRYTTENDLRPFVLPVGALREGVNVIAVEVHNRSLGSSDLSFDLSLRAD